MDEEEDDTEEAVAFASAAVVPESEKQLIEPYLFLHTCQDPFELIDDVSARIQETLRTNEMLQELLNTQKLSNERLAGQLRAVSTELAAKQQRAAGLKDETAAETHVLQSAHQFSRSESIRLQSSVLLLTERLASLKREGALLEARRSEAAEVLQTNSRKLETLERRNLELVTAVNALTGTVVDEVPELRPPPIPAIGQAEDSRKDRAARKRVRDRRKSRMVSADISR
mmetsp:Transcript_56545/g.123970  ORF Transcript_56545/g.123970 Transcript_56545/m.123970 type:complete len:228 (+) Transcript_56545:42-725(+)